MYRAARYRRVLSLLFILYLLSGCVADRFQQHPAEAVQRGEPAVFQEEEGAGPEPVHFSALLTDPNAKVEWGKDPVSQRILEKTGVHLDFEVLSGDINHKIGIMLAGRDYPDLLLSVPNEAVAKFIENGALQPLDDYIETYGVHMKPLFGDDLVYMRSEMDDHIYGLNRNYQEISLQSSMLFHVQYHMLIEAGYPLLESLDDLYLLIKEYKEKYPAFLGKETIGLSAWAASYGMNVSFNNPALRAGGYENDGNYIVQENLDVQYGLTSPAARAYFQWLNKLHREGLFDQEAVVQSRDMFVSKVSSGRVLAVTTESWDISDIQTLLRNQELFDRCYASFPLVLSKEIDMRISDYDHTGSWKSVITDRCKDPVRAFQFFDTMWSEEMQILCNWGIEDVHYTVENGQRVLKQEIYDMMYKDSEWRNKTGISMYNMWSVGENVRGSDGQYIIPFSNREALIRMQDPVTKEILSHYRIEIWNDLFPQPRPGTREFVWKLTLPQDSEGAIAEAKVNDDIRRKAIPKIVLANSDEEFQQEWEAFAMAVEEAGISYREKEIGEVLRRRALMR